MISLLLLQRIAQMFMIMSIGWVLVRIHLMKSVDSLPFSLLIMYVASPCAILGAFQLENSPERQKGLFLALAAAILTHIVFFILLKIMKRPLHLSSVDQAAVFYPNAGNLAIPVISGVFGREYVLYTCAFLVIQQLLMWSHGRSLVSGEKSVSPKKVITNPNVLATLVGLAMFLTGIRLPSIVQGAVTSVGDLLGPLAMLVAGMVLADMNLLESMRDLSIWKVALLRLIVFPFAAATLLKAGGFAGMVNEGELILTVSLLSAAGPSASMVIQMAQAYGKDPGRAGAINALTTIFCIFTIPAIVFYFQFHI